MGNNLRKQTLCVCTIITAEGCSYEEVIGLPGEGREGWMEEGRLKKGKGMFLYITVSSPLDRSKRFTLFLPWQTCSCRHNSASLGSVLAMQQLRNDYPLPFLPLSIARYSFIQLSRLRHRE